jgi:glucosamine--fructose-6-phosphate aminotransferase (isomerizing)
MNSFLKEIFSQAKALENTFQYILSEGKPQFLKVKDFIKKGGVTKLIFTGMGSSYIASYLPYYFLNQNGIAVEMREAGEFLFNTFPKSRQESFKDTGIVIISQSGKSGEIRELLRRINSIEVKPLTIGITNDPDSYLAYMSELQIFMNIDEELSVTTTTYVCTLLILYIMSKTIVGEFFNNDDEIQNVLDLIYKVKKLLENEREINEIWQNIVSNFGKDVEFIEILARGSSIVTAHQAALNCKEIIKSYSEAQSVSNFRHGGIECLKNNTKIILLTSDGENLDFNVEFIRQLKKWRFEKLLHITNQDFNEDLANLHDDQKIMRYNYNVKDSFLAPIYEIIVLQLLFYKIAELNGLEPGEFKFSTKVTHDL